MLLISIVIYEQQRYVKASDRCFYNENNELH